MGEPIDWQEHAEFVADDMYDSDEPEKALSKWLEQAWRDGYAQAVSDAEEEPWWTVRIRVSEAPPGGAQEYAAWKACVASEFDGAWKDLMARARNAREDDRNEPT